MVVFNIYDYQKISYLFIPPIYKNENMNFYNDLKRIEVFILNYSIYLLLIIKKICLFSIFTIIKKFHIFFITTYL